MIERTEERFEIKPAYRGRIVKTTGDGALVEFASAVDKQKQ
jgi:class 3 adenylate cyclase